MPSKPEKLVLAYGDELLQMARTRKDIVVLDGDLLSDCGIEAFKAELPERFIECGIAEQHMVSAAGGMALEGLLPVVHSFACFLSTRANEHIYNNATERRKIIYTATLAGAIPGGPGHSHQSVRDISAIGSVPGSNRDRAVLPNVKRASRSAGRSKRTTQARICVSSTCRSTCRTRCPRRTRSKSGRGVTLRGGADVALVGYGPVLLSNAWRAAEELAAEGVRAAVINLPWLNRIDDAWTRDVLGTFPVIVTLDNHYRLARAGRDGRRRTRAQRRPRCRPHPWADRRARVRRRTPKCSPVMVSTPPRSHDRRSLMYPNEVLHWIDDAEVASGGSAVIGDSFEKRSPGDDHV